MFFLKAAELTDAMVERIRYKTSHRKINKVTGLAYPPYGRARELDRLRSSEVCPRSGLPGAKCAGEAAPDPETDLRVRPPVGRIPDAAEAKLKMGNPIGLTDPLHRRHPWRAHWRCGAGVPDGCGARALFPTMKAWTSSRVSMPSLLTSIALKMRS